MREFFTDQNLEEVTKVNSKTGLKTIKVRAKNPLPTTIRRKATEALNNIRHSFDQSAYAACLAAKKPLAKVLFPWSANPTDLRRLLENRKITPELWETFERQEPYRRSEAYAGGDDVIRELATIANGKHTVGLRIGAHVAGMKLGRITGGGFQISTPKWNPVKNEMILIAGTGDFTFDRNYQIAFHVALQESGALRDVILSDALRTFLKKAEKVLNDLEARCVEIVG